MNSIRYSMISRLTRLYPFCSGCGGIANSKIIRYLSGFSSDCVWTKVPGGELLAPLDDYVGRAAYFLGDLDRKLTRLCSLIVKPGDTVLDIGANLGLMTLQLSRLVGENGHVHAFEPNPTMQEFVKKVIERNKLFNTRLHPFGLGDANGVLKLTVPKGNAGAGSLVRNIERAGCDVVEVPVRTLSEVVEREGITSIKMIKIDVEGFEAQVFQGGHSVLARLKPEAILFEQNDHWDGPLIAHPCFRILGDLGYGFFSIPNSYLKVHILPLVLDANDKIKSHDFLAVPKGSAYERVQSVINS